MKHIILVILMIPFGGALASAQFVTLDQSLKALSTHADDAVPSGCFDATLEGRDLGALAQRGGAKYISCAQGTRYKSVPVSPIDPDNNRRVEEAFKKVTHCLQIDPLQIFPLWSEESSLQINVKHPTMDFVGVSQMTRGSVEDAIQTLLNPTQFQMVLNHLGVSNTPSTAECAALADQAVAAASEIKTRLANAKKKKGMVTVCDWSKNLVDGPDATILNMYFAGIIYTKTIFYFENDLKKSAKNNSVFKAAMENFRFASSADARKILSVILRESGVGHTNASEHLEKIILHYAQGGGNNPLKFDTFARDFLNNGASGFVANKHIVNAARTKIKPHLPKTLKLSDCVKFVGPGEPTTSTATSIPSRSSGHVAP